MSSKNIDVYLEVGQKRTIAGALEWPGWSRSGRDEDEALQALADYGARYAAILDAAQISFRAPADASRFVVVERLVGDATTDFGAPGKAPSDDARPVDASELRRLETLLQAYWQAFDTEVQAAAGKELRKGPRGGGRDLDPIVQHVLESDGSYLSALGWKHKQRTEQAVSEQLAATRQAILDGLAAAVRGELPTHGPRGGARWTPRYFVRRLAWHLLDHLWEIKDRVTSG